MTTRSGARPLLPFGAALVAVLTAPSWCLAEGTPDVAEACALAAERGQVAHRSGKLLLARKELRACGAAECPSIVRADCLRWLAQVDEELPSVIIRASDTLGADVMSVGVYANGDRLTQELDGGALVLDPGRYRMRYETPSGDRIEETVLVRVGEKRRVLSVRFPGPVGARGAMAPGSPLLPAEPTRDDRASVRGDGTTGSPNALAYVFGGLSLASLGAFTYFEVQGQNGYDDLQGGCGRTRSCGANDTGPVRTDFVLAGSFLAASVAFLGVATWQYLASAGARPSAQPPRTRLQLIVRF